MPDPTWSERLAWHAMDLNEEGHDVGQAGKWKQPVRVATTAPGTLATSFEAGDTIDGVTLADGDRILLKDQSADDENGIYIVGTGTPIRAEDFDTGSEALGSVVYVIAGTTNSGKAYRLTNTTEPTIDTDPLTFAEFGGGSTVTEITDLPTAETDTAKRLRPDGAGGVEWVASGGATITVDGPPDGPVTGVDTIVFADANDATVSVVDDGAGQVTVTVDATAGGGGSDPTIPSGGTLYDGTSTAGWTQFGSGGLTTFDANTTVPDALFLEKTSTGGNNDYGVYRAVGGSFPRTYTMKIKSALSYANYHGIGLMFGDSTPTAHQTWTLTHDTTYVTGLAPQRTAWTSPTSAGANTAYPGSSNPGLSPQIPFWLQVVVTSSSSVAFNASRDGYHYYTFASGINPGFTIATFGIVIFGFGIDMRGSVDWIHET